MKAVRAVLMVVGLIAGGVGAWYLLDSGFDNIVAAFWWLAGGVIAHDGLLAPVVVVVGVIGSRLLPDWLRGPVAVGWIVLGTVSLAALPMLGRFGALSDNDTLLDRNYLGGWLVLLALVVIGVALAATRRRTSPDAAGSPSVHGRS